jgi:hypothetical protein
VSACQAFDEAVLDLFNEAAALDAGRACQVRVEDEWRTVPLEWNGAMRLAEIFGTEARMIDARGEPFRTHPEQAAHA